MLPATLIGTKIGAYRITRAIGEGGMSVVYEAVHETIAQRAAVKVLQKELSSQPDAMGRFLTEARAVALVRHPDLVQIFDFGQLEDGTAYLLMEFLEGESLAERVGRGPLPLRDVLRLGRQIAAALALTHGKGIVHRDLKPENVIIVSDHQAEGGERAKLLDFGIAKVLGSSKLRGTFDELPGSRLQTQAGVILGTPAYMSPEQSQGSEITESVDVYALGVLLFEMIVGRPPFDGLGPTEIILKHIAVPPPQLRVVAPETPPQLSALVGEMLAKAPAQRPRMEEVARRLSEIAERVAGPPRPRSPQEDLTGAVALPAVPVPRRTRLVLYAAVGGGAMLLAMTLGGRLIGRLSPRAGPRAEAVAQAASVRPAGASAQVAVAVQAAPPRWRLTTTPPGAAVLRGQDGAPLGVTPFTAEGGAEPLRLVLRLPGYADREVMLHCTGTCETLVVLAPQARRPRSRPANTPPIGPLSRGLGELPD